MTLMIANCVPVPAHMYLPVQVALCVAATGEPDVESAVEESKDKVRHTMHTNP